MDQSFNSNQPAIPFADQEKQSVLNQINIIMKVD